MIPVLHHHPSLESLALQAFGTPDADPRRKTLTTASLADGAADWDAVLAQTRHVPVAYTRANVRYQHLYQCCHSDEVLELSRVIYWDRRPVAVWPLALARVGDKVHLGSFGQPVLPPLFDARLPERPVKQVVATCQQLAAALARQAGLADWPSRHSFNGLHGLPEWHQQAMTAGATVDVDHELLLDLSAPLEDIRLGLRKSYRPLISQGARLWQIQCLAQVDDRLWQQFRSLHHQAAGRQTRSDASWDEQRDQVNRGDAFLVCLRNIEERMVGAGLFTMSRDEAVYAVGAYDRDLFDLPLGHVVQFRAIERMKELGLSWYRIGDRPYPADASSPDDKEIRIAEFKQGFASHLCARFLLRHPVAAT